VHNADAHEMNSLIIREGIKGANIPLHIMPSREEPCGGVIGDLRQVTKAVVGENVDIFSGCHRRDVPGAWEVFPSVHSEATNTIRFMNENPLTEFCSDGEPASSRWVEDGTGDTCRHKLPIFKGLHLRPERFGPDVRGSSTRLGKQIQDSHSKHLC